MVSEKAIKYFFADNTQTIKSLLMDGELVRENLLDRSNLEKTVNRMHDIEKGDVFNLHAFLTAEIWARKVKSDTLSR